MAEIIVRTTTRRVNDLWADFVQVIIGGLLFETRANSPEHARELAQRVSLLLPLTQEKK
jgi:hypothetical protein